MLFAGLVPVSLVDFPGHVATTLFTQGCNLRCGWCHNPLLVEGPPAERPLSATDALSFLGKRKRLVQHVCITGGEPTLHRGLIPFLQALREQGFHVKLDTNGGRPDVVAEVLRQGLVDWISMDLKTTWARYAELGAKRWEPFAQTVEWIRSKAPEYEFRTTVVPGLVGAEEIFAVGGSIRGARRYALQQFSTASRMLDPAWTSVEPYPPERLYAWARAMDGWFQEPVQVRNV